MKPCLWLLFAALVMPLVAGLGEEPYRAHLYRAKNRTENSYIVVLMEGPDPEEFIKTFSEANTTKFFDAKTVKHVYSTVLKGFSAKLTPEALEELRGHENVRYISEDGEVYAASAPSWGQDRINQQYLPLDGIYQHDGDGTGVRAYFIDTGVYPQSLYFNGRAVVGTDILGGNGIDGNGHGTHVAGTVGGTTYGVATNVNIIGVKVISDSGSGTWSDLIAGCEWVANNAVKPAVVNLALVGPGHHAADEAVKGMINTGITAVAAAGGSNADACNYSPARVAEVITVSATDSSDNRYSRSNYGTCVDIFAPGSAIPSAWIGSPEAVQTRWGTSHSTAHVTGAVALLLQKNQCTLSPAKVKANILAKATAGAVKNRGTDSPDRFLYVAPNA